MASPSFKAILPKKSVITAKQAGAGISTLLLATAQIAQREMQNYPAARPWKNPPRTGLRAGGRRTGAYGRGWGPTATVAVRQDSITVYNPVSYAVWVGGSRKKYPGQARALEARNWQSVDNLPEIVIQKLSKAKLLKLVVD